MPGEINCLTLSKIHGGTKKKRLPCRSSMWGMIDDRWSYLLKDPTSRLGQPSLKESPQTYWREYLWWMVGWENTGRLDFRQCFGVMRLLDDFKWHLISEFVQSSWALDGASKFVIASGDSGLDTYTLPHCHSFSEIIWCWANGWIGWTGLSRNWQDKLETAARILRMIFDSSVGRTWLSAESSAVRNYSSVLYILP